MSASRHVQRWIRAQRGSPDPAVGPTEGLLPVEPGLPPLPPTLPPKPLQLDSDKLLKQLIVSMLGQVASRLLQNVDVIGEWQQQAGDIQVIGSHRRQKGPAPPGIRPVSQQQLHELNRPMPCRV